MINFVLQHVKIEYVIESRARVINVRVATLAQCVNTSVLAHVKELATKPHSTASAVVRPDFMGNYAVRSAPLPVGTKHVTKLQAIV